MDNGASKEGPGGSELADEAAIYQHLKLKKKGEGFICSWSVWNVLLWLAADRLANSDASYQTVLEHLSVQARQTTDKPSSHPAASLDSVKLHQPKLYSLASLASFIWKTS